MATSFGTTNARGVDGLGVHYRTLQRWVSLYRTRGVEEVLSHRMKGLDTCRRTAAPGS